MICAAFIVSITFGIVAVAAASFTRNEVVAYASHFSAVMNDHMLRNPDLANDLLFTPNSVQEFLMFDEWRRGTYDEVIKPFALMGKHFSLVNKPNAINDNVLVVDFATAQTTVTDCKWTCTGSAVLELTRNAAGEIRASKHTVYMDNDNCGSLKKCLDEMGEKKKDL